MSYTSTQHTSRTQNQTRSTGFTPTPQEASQHTPQQAPQQQPQREQLDPFQRRFDSPRRLPRELRAEAMGMSWALFSATYAPSPTVKFSDIRSSHDHWCYTTYSADLTRTSKTFPPQTTRHEVTSSGPAHAFGAMLAEEGRYVEILEFHQFQLHEATFTAIKVAHQINERNTAWAIGFGATSESSIAAAMASGAQRIYG
ncbi:MULTISPECIES: acetyl-CoA acetyltransferase [unclassified Corynebacterium]|uniref:acetyl-CoA acetyltransferase n=1 Tax=unclassified Corynebacterium TaxID=2624378 RepID=UPI0026504716|nr:MULTISPECIES: acetyl-CoA acetyltransferase [unclassified Corynebacterium]MDN8595514.1 acetyl-CoA acetyltransferase [Corynebacterium sp. P4_F2]WKK55388.1 acetyl-CoA acetyltransferase [Corynebacterium sp. P4-C1]WKK62797.1 acetyl-CoA acetyltransferase [Corynebacterium sp. P8-C1]